MKCGFAVAVAHVLRLLLYLVGVVVQAIHRGGVVELFPGVLLFPGQVEEENHLTIDKQFKFEIV